MRKIDCPVPAEELRRLYLDDKLADPAIVERLGAGATLKRVRAWRKRFGIETISPSERNYVPPIEGSLRSLLVGSMLGDGGLNRQPNSTRYMENHANNQKEYLEWKQAQWGSWDQVGIKPVTWVLKGQSFAGWRFATVCHPSLNEWHALFYGGPKGPKRLEREVVDLVDELALAIWFMDDGSAGWWPCFTFGMDLVSRGIAYAIFDKFGFHPEWAPHQGKTGDFLLKGEDQANRFIALVKPHMPECMHYKLKFGFQGRHYQIRQSLTEETLRSLASDGVPIREMSRRLGVGYQTVSNHLKDFGIHHPRKVGRPVKCVGVITQTQESEI